MLRYGFLILLLFMISTGCSTSRNTMECETVRASADRSTQEAIHLNVEALSPAHIERVKALVLKLQPFINERDQKGTLPVLTFAELEAPLTPDEKKFLNAFRNLTGAEIGVSIPYQGIAQGFPDAVKVTGQKILIKGKEKELSPQFLAKPVFEAYEAMMQAMEQDLKKRLYIESAYRSSAHQLYLIIFYLNNHHYSLCETAKWVALPGYSEHGNPVHQALDLINAEGVNGEESIPEYEALPEFKWLLQNASRFGFVLSYPKNVGPGITYEPWHWRYEGKTTP